MPRRTSRAPDGITPARRAAYEVAAAGLRGRRLGRPRLRRGGERYELDGPRARPGPAPRLRRGPAQRHDRHLLARLAGRPRPRDRPAARSPRCGSASTSCCSPTPPPTTPRSTRRSSWRRRDRRDGAPPPGAGGAGFVNAVLRRAAAEREELLARARRHDPGGRGDRRTPIRTGSPRCGGRSSAPHEAAALMRGDERAGRDGAFGSTRLRAEPAGVAARPARRRGRGPGPGRRRAAGRRRRRSSSTAGGSGRGPRSRPASWCRSRAARRPSSRCSTRSRASACSTSAPGPGSRRPRSPRAWATRRDRLRRGAIERRAAEIEALCERVGAGCVRVEVADAAEADLGSGYDRVLVDPPCSDLGTLASRPDARWRKSPGADRAPGALQRRILARGARALRPGGRSSTRPARSPRARTRPSPARSRSAPAGSPPTTRSRVPRARSRPRPPIPADAPRPRPDDGFFIARFAGGLMEAEGGGRRSRRSSVPACPGCGEPWLRPTQLPGRFRCVYCLRRYELVSGARTAASTRRSCGCRPTRTCSASIAATRC